MKQGAFPLTQIGRLAVRPAQALLCLSLFAQDIPPLPPKQYPYITTTTQKRTNVVTTVLELKFLRIDEGGETNLIPIRTNIVSVISTNL